MNRLPSINTMHLHLYLDLYLSFLFSMPFELFSIYYGSFDLSTT